MCPPDAPVVLEAEHLCSLDVKDVSFQLHKGEILGFAGLVGAGRTELMRVIYGADPMVKTQEKTVDWRYIALSIFVVVALVILVEPAIAAARKKVKKLAKKK